MNRRMFVVSAISFLLSNNAFANMKVGGELNVYIDESGNKGDIEPFVIGALIIDSEYDKRRLETIRSKSTYKPTLKYSNSNKYKKLLATPFINEFFQNDLMSFSAIVIPPSLNEKWPSNKNVRTNLYHHNYSRFIKSMNSKFSKTNIFLEKRTTTGQDNYLKKFITENSSQIEVNFLNERESNCIQLSDLLTGSIYGELTNVEDKVKKSIIDEIRSHLNVKTLAKQFEFNGGKYTTKIINQL